MEHPVCCWHKSKLLFLKNSYGAPPAAPSYDAPAPSYDAPAAPSYDAPATGYDAPSSGYGDVSGYGAEEEDIDLSFILYFSLIIIGLSLLFPSITELTDVNTTGTNTGNNFIVGRKRRHAGYGENLRNLTYIKGVKFTRCLYFFCFFKCWHFFEFLWWYTAKRGKILGRG